MQFNIPVKSILDCLPKAACVGNKELVVKSVIAINILNENPNALMWANTKNLEKAYALNRGVLIVSKDIDVVKLNAGVTYILVKNPKFSFLTVLNALFQEKEAISIAPNAIIDASSVVQKNVYIGNNVVIEANCSIAERVSIGHNTVIKKGTVIAEGVKIGSNCTIGGVGFGYDKDEQGNYQPLHHLGNVVIHKNAEIGNNTCIDRAALGSTVIGANVKIDNLVHIAHGVNIGENSLIIANAMIAGSVEIGSHVWVAPSSSIIQKKHIGNNAVIGMGAVVLKDVAEGEVIVGNPGKKLNNNT